MLISDDSIPIAALATLFFSLLITGLLLTIPLFKFDLRRFFNSSLFIKIIFWVPIFVVFVGTLYVTNPFRLAVLLAVLLIAFIEILRVAQNKHDRRLYVFYLLFVIGMSHFYLLVTKHPASFINTLIIICFATALSDVVAFFMGNYLGKHKLPDRLNGNKSWEGVLGQIIGALIGVLLIDAFVFNVPILMLFLPIGLGCVLGDLANSYSKRLAGIKDWGNSLPGHGGFLDRFSSFAGSAFLVFYFLKFFS